MIPGGGGSATRACDTWRIMNRISNPQNGVNVGPRTARASTNSVTTSTPIELAMSTAFGGARVVVQPAVPAAGEDVQVVVVVGVGEGARADQALGEEPQDEPGDDGADSQADGLEAGQGLPPLTLALSPQAGRGDDRVGAMHLPFARAGRRLG